MSIPTLSPDDVCACLAEFHVVDVREGFEFNGPVGHVAGAEHHPLGSLTVSLADHPAVERMLLVCGSGRRARTAVALLQGQGFWDATCLAGGMRAWVAAGHPVERSEPVTVQELRDDVISWFSVTCDAPLHQTREKIACILSEAGDRYERPTPTSLDRLLGGLQAIALARGADRGETGAFVDLYRRTLAVL
jgi:rhodanese-related sulfurtransferase